jgi:2,3-bisphosphoglycerate-dependent phosphoglycerate mutase
MGATRIIAIRHGETAWNAETRLQGHLDIPLNSRGRWQATRAAHALADENIAAIYASDLLRAKETAQAIAALPPRSAPAPLHLDPGLRERGFGIFEGRTYAEIETVWPEMAERWRVREPDFAPEGGETLVQVRERVARTVNTLASQHLGEQIVLVAHGGVMDALYRLATQQAINAPRTWELGNASINRLLWTPEALTLVGWSDTQHLEEASMDESFS